MSETAEILAEALKGHIPTCNLKTIETEVELQKNNVYLELNIVMKGITRWNVPAEWIDKIVSIIDKNEERYYGKISHIAPHSLTIKRIDFLEEKKQMSDKPDYEVTCPACGDKTLGRWGKHYICSTCGAQRVAMTDKTYKYFGFTEKQFKQVEPEEAELIAKGLIPGKRKIVINSCFGGFGISQKALHRMRELGNKYALEEVDFGEKYDSGEKRKPWGGEGETGSFHLYGIPRDDPDLVQVVEELGSKASGRYAQLKIVEVPDNVEFSIEEYDGREHIAEKHRMWR